VHDASPNPPDSTPAAFEPEPERDRERSAALDGWVAAFDREIEKTGDFAKSIAAMTEHGCFDVRAVVERWVIANPTGTVIPAQVEAEPQEPVPLRLVVDEPPAVEEATAPPEPSLDVEASAADASAVELDVDRMSRRPGAASSPDIAYFHSLLQGGIERAQIDEAFPGFRLVIDEAVSQHEAATGPILRDDPTAPASREDLNDEIRGMRRKLQESATRGRRRWRTRD
jgi:hypothetical protein